MRRIDFVPHRAYRGATYACRCSDARGGQQGDGQLAEILIPIHDRAGHRQEYIDLFRGELEAAGHRVRHDRLRLRHLFFRGPVLSLMLEEHPMTFSALAFGRWLMGRRSATLMFRPHEAGTGVTPRLRAKRAALRAVKAVQAGEVLTILPFDRGSTVDRIASGWIYDPQLWDWIARAPAADQAMLDLVRERAAGRQVVVAIGVQNRGKGFDFFTALWRASEEVRRTMLFVCAGNAAGCDPEMKRQFKEAGGLLVDRFLSTEEIRALYDAADLVWACYAPDYDLASGIFGRAFQLGVPAIIRAGANLRVLSDRIGYDPIEIPWDDTDRAAAILLHHQRGRTAGAMPAIGLREQSLATVFGAIGLMPEPARS